MMSVFSANLLIMTLTFALGSLGSTFGLFGSSSTTSGFSFFKTESLFDYFRLEEALLPLDELEAAESRFEPFQSFFGLKV
jgi:hypothetical protein